jgi:hypothetical protein
MIDFRQSFTAPAVGMHRKQQRLHKKIQGENDDTAKEIQHHSDSNKYLIHGKVLEAFHFNKDVGFLKLSEDEIKIRI